MWFIEKKKTRVRTKNSYKGQPEKRGWLSSSYQLIKDIGFFTVLGYKNIIFFLFLFDTAFDWLCMLSFGHGMLSIYPELYQIKSNRFWWIGSGSRRYTGTPYTAIFAYTSNSWIQCLLYSGRLYCWWSRCKLQRKLRLFQLLSWKNVYWWKLFLVHLSFRMPTFFLE